MDTSFLATFGTVVFFFVLIALLVQVPLIVWLISIALLAIIGLFNK